MLESLAVGTSQSCTLVSYCITIQVQIELKEIQSRYFELFWHVQN